MCSAACLIGKGLIGGGPQAICVAFSCGLPLSLKKISASLSSLKPINKKARNVSKMENWDLFSEWGFWILTPIECGRLNIAKNHSTIDNHFFTWFMCIQIQIWPNTLRQKFPSNRVINFSWHLLPRPLHFESWFKTDYEKWSQTLFIVKYLELSISWCSRFSALMLLILVFRLISYVGASHCQIRV